ncbi:MAG: spinster family MFS transporter [Chthoniobacterales bacterium]
MSNADRRLPGARASLALLLSINLFNYIDRQILAAVEPNIRDTFFAPGDPNAMAMTGILATAFLVSYMLSAPLLGALADRFSRWTIVGVAVILWSLASGGSGLAATFGLLVATRIFVGIGEGGYGPAAPTILSDLYPLSTRGRVLTVFNVAIPVGSALGFVLGGIITAHFGWRYAFYFVTAPGILLGVLCFFRRDYRAQKREPLNVRAVAEIFRTRSYLLNVLAQTAFTFGIAGLGFWMAAYLRFRNQPEVAGKTIFGGILVVAGFVATLFGGWVADRLRTKIRGSYFVVSGAGMLIAFPLFVGALFTPFPLAWLLIFAAIFFAFVNTGPSNAALANVTRPPIRATAFAFNILIIHAFGDAISPPVIGWIAGHSNMTVAFLCVSATMLLAGIFWMLGRKFLDEETRIVESASVIPVQQNSRSG